jgi:ribosomal protein S27AE
MVNYKNGKIYKIINDVDNEIYVGSTCEKLSMRMARHRKSRKELKKCNSKLYQHMNLIGIEHFKIYLIENYPCDNKEELERREGQIIKQFGTLNSLIAGRTKKEWCEDNKKHLIEYHKQWYKDNKEKIAEQKRIKIVCPLCGSNSQKTHINRHQRSIKCIEAYNNSDPYDTDYVEFKQK